MLHSSLHSVGGVRHTSGTNPLNGQENDHFTCRKAPKTAQIHKKEGKILKISADQILAGKNVGFLKVIYNGSVSLAGRKKRYFHSHFVSIPVLATPRTPKS